MINFACSMCFIFGMGFIFKLLVMEEKVAIFLSFFRSFFLFTFSNKNFHFSLLFYFPCHLFSISFTVFHASLIFIGFWPHFSMRNFFLIFSKRIFFLVLLFRFILPSATFSRYLLSFNLIGISSLFLPFSIRFTFIIFFLSYILYFSFYNIPFLSFFLSFFLQKLLSSSF